MEKIVEQIDIGDTEWELNEMLRKYRPEVIAKILDKIVEIVDYLNIQPQAEEKPVDKLFRLRVELDKQGVKDYEHTAVETYKQATQSTPEQKEEGGCKGFWSYYRHKGDDRELAYLIVDGEKFLSEESVKNLLSERERWAIDTFLKDTASYNSFHNGRPRTMRNGLSGEGFEVRVSKLTTK